MYHLIVKETSLSKNMPPNQKIPDNIDGLSSLTVVNESQGNDTGTFIERDTPAAVQGRNDDDVIFRCAILGCGMMGQEHVSYIMGFPNDVRIDYLCDPFEPSLQAAQKVMEEFHSKQSNQLLGAETDVGPILLRNEEELLLHANNIDLLVIGECP